jgi:hypothetical protein
MCCVVLCCVVLCPFGLALCVGLSLERERETVSMPDRDLSQTLASTGSSSSRDKVAGRPAGRPPACFRQQQPKFSKVTFQTTLQYSSVSISPRTVFRNVK